jgi:hypothetical protein
LRIGDNVLFGHTEKDGRCYVPQERWQQIVIQSNGSEKLYHPTWHQLLERPARLVHIDGAHVRKAVLYDLSLAAGYLAPGGLIIFDDFCSEYFPDVTTGIIDGLRTHPHIRPIERVTLPGQQPRRWWPWRRAG